MKIVEVKHLSYCYVEDKFALKDVSFSLEEGSYCCLIGHNGSGKSTLAKCLMGLQPDFDGEITLFGLPLLRKNIYAIRSKVGIVFQNPDNQFVGSTVADDIAFGLENKCVPHEEMQSIIERFAQETGMLDYLDREPSMLSGGQKQRVAIAGVLAMGPDLIIFDEATSMLDPKGKKEIIDLVHRLRAQNPKLTVLSITHDVEEAARADEVIVLNEGQLFLQGKPEEVFSHQAELESIRLETPFFYSLLAELKKNGVNVPDSVKDLSSLEAFLCR
ncbi:MAG: energy-coupling factor transporter ATPase [Bacilli bacterium]|nr:energy-coupling factor transporter ATPase [Bacilli bacterium]